MFRLLWGFVYCVETLFGTFLGVFICHHERQSLVHKIQRGLRRQDIVRISDNGA